MSQIRQLEVMLSEFLWHSKKYRDRKHVTWRLYWHKYFDDDFFVDSVSKVHSMLRNVESLLFSTQEEYSLDKSHRERQFKIIFEDLINHLGCSFFTYLTRHILNDDGAYLFPTIHLPLRLLKGIINEKFKTINAEKHLENIIDKNLDIELDIDFEFISNFRRYEWHLNYLLCCSVREDYFHVRNRKQFFQTIIRYRRILLDNPREIPIDVRADLLCNIYIKSSQFLESHIMSCVHDATEFQPRIEPYDELLLLMKSLVNKYLERITSNPYPERLAHYEWICDNMGFKSRRRSLILSLHKKLGSDKDTITTISQKIFVYAGWL